MMFLKQSITRSSINWCNRSRLTTNSIRKFSSSTDVLYSVDDEGFATLTLNRPKVHNAFSDVVIKQIDLALSDARNARGIRGLFVRSNGKNFCAGGDLEWMKRAAKYSYEENIEDAMVLSGMLKNLSTLPFPSIALVQGAAFGGGVGLISACDIAVAVERSTFTLSEVKLGIIPATISPYVVERIGVNQCRRYFLTAERFNAEKALQIGLLHETVEDEAALETKAQELKQSILTNAPTAVAASKELIQAVAGKGLGEEVLLDTSKRLADQRRSDEGIEGITAFFEKRPAAWIPSKEF